MFNETTSVCKVAPPGGPQPQQQPPPQQQQQAPQAVAGNAEAQLISFDWKPPCCGVWHTTSSILLSCLPLDSKDALWKHNYHLHLLPPRCDVVAM